MKLLATLLGPRLFLIVGERRYPVSSYSQASRMFCMARDRHGQGASRTPVIEIANRRGKIVAHVSYNGRVWRGAEGSWKEGDKPLYTPSL